MFASGIAFVCFYHAERVLSAIAKFLVHLLFFGGGRVKWERGEIGEESGEKTERVCRCVGKGNARKNSPKRNRFGTIMTLLQLLIPTRVIYFRKIFHA